MSGEKQLIVWELSGQISLESDWFCTDLTNVFKQKRLQFCQLFWKMMGISLCNNNSSRNTDYLEVLPL